MIKSTSMVRVLLCTATMVLGAQTTLAGDGHWQANRYAQRTPWHGQYQNTEWGSRVALVVPPTAGLTTDWGWGVGSNRITRIRHQFCRLLPSAEAGGPAARSTPNWPTDTSQHGVYYVRGPW